MVAIRFDEQKVVLIGCSQRHVHILDLGTYIFTRGPDLLCGRSGTVAAIINLGGMPHLVAFGGLKRLPSGGIGPIKVEILNLRLSGSAWRQGTLVVQLNVYIYIYFEFVIIIYMFLS